MTDLRIRRPDGRDWRHHLTAEEGREIAVLDRIIRSFTIPRALIKARQSRQKIQNRATARAGKNGKTK